MPGDSEPRLSTGSAAPSQYLFNIQAHYCKLLHCNVLRIEVVANGSFPEQQRQSALIKGTQCAPIVIVHIHVQYIYCPVHYMYENVLKQNFLKNVQLLFYSLDKLQLLLSCSYLFDIYRAFRH